MLKWDLSPLIHENPQIKDQKDEWIISFLNPIINPQTKVRFIR